MKPERCMAFVGVTDTISLRIRQQIRRIDDRLDHDWKWVSADNPDLVFIDPDSDAGKMARGRAKVTGMRYIEVIDAETPAGDAPTLQLPIRLDRLVALLNDAGAVTVTTGQLSHQNAADFYLRDLHDQDSINSVPTGSSLLESIDQPTDGLEDVIRHSELDTADKQVYRFDPNAEVSGGGGPTSRSQQYADRAVDRGLQVDDDRLGDNHSPYARAGTSTPSINAVPWTTGEQEVAGWPLIRFLGNEGPTRPSRYQLEGSPDLLLDPKSHEFRIDGDLSQAAPYCQQSIASAGWTALGSAQVNDMRSLKPRPYSELVWLHTWLNGTGRLSQKLDPGGAYQLRQCIDIDHTFRHHHDITVLMQSPIRLHEIASQAGVSMDQVFDLVNAYDAIGALEWTRRARRDDSEQDAQSARPGGLLSRVWPFKR